MLEQVIKIDKQEGQSWNLKTFKVWNSGFETYLGTLVLKKEERKKPGKKIKNQVPN